MLQKISNKLQYDDQALILWEKHHGFLQLDATFQSYANVDNSSFPLFSTNIGNILGRDCFWILKKHIQSDKDIDKYQKLIIPLQIKMAILAHMFNMPLDLKIINQEILNVIEEKKQNINKIQNFVEKYGFDPTDDTWVETAMAENDIEKKWFKFTRVNKLPAHNTDVISKFNAQENTNISVEEAIELTKKKMRYILGSFVIRYNGEKDVEKWKAAAQDFEQEFRERDKRVKNWVLSRNKIMPLVTTVKPIEFWHGNILVKCIEKIPHFFVSPDCEFIKPGVVLEVVGYDPQDKWINLDFPKDIRKALTGQEEPLLEPTYAIVLHPKDSDSLDGIDQLDRKIV